MGFFDEFQKRRGYDARPLLPALADKTVDSPEITARFQWDYQRTAADLFAANYYGRLGRVGPAARPGAGLRIRRAPSSPTRSTALECEGINEVPMGEFWKRDWEPDGRSFHIDRSSKEAVDTVRQAASAAHIYGQADLRGRGLHVHSEDWIDDPWCLKDIGDAAFCNGLTRMVMHGLVTQPRLDVVPGTTGATWGPTSILTSTWWDMSHAWLRYLRRCQYMLRQGRFVADLAYYYGEGATTLRPLQVHD